jgi:subtilisin family serine protease
MHTPACACLLALAAATAASASAPPSAPASADSPPRIVVAFANQPQAAPGPAGTTGRRYAGDGYRVAQGAQLEARRVAARYALRQVASWPIRALGMHCVVYEIAGGRGAPEVLAALAHDPRVALAEPLNEFHTLTAASDTGAAAPAYNDPLYDLQTNLRALAIPAAHRRAQGAGIRIALIDTGVDSQHPDLRGRILQTRSFLTPAHRPARLVRHGTAMAGIIAAVANNHIGIVGIAPRAQLLVYEACWQLKPDDDAAACNTFTLAQALAAALESGAPLVNLSVGGPADALLGALVDVGIRRGVVFVGAGAADAGAADAGFPAGVAGVLVAAGSEGAAPRDALPAPARHVLTLRPGGEYDFESGASVAAAELTGVVALLMSASPARLTAPRLSALLRDSGAAAPGADPPPVNAAVALARLDGP